MVLGFLKKEWSKKKTLNFGKKQSEEICSERNGKFEIKGLRL